MPPRGNDDRYTRKCGRSTNIGHFDVHTQTHGHILYSSTNKNLPACVGHTITTKKKKKQPYTLSAQCMTDRLKITRAYTHTLIIHTRTHKHKHGSRATQNHFVACCVYTYTKCNDIYLTHKMPPYALRATLKPNEGALNTLPCR